MSVTKIIRHFLLYFGIVLTMVDLFSIASHAKASFKDSMPVGVMATAVDDKVIVSWEPLEDAIGYQILEGQEKGSYRECGNTPACRLELSDREPGKEYYYFVRAYREGINGGRIYSGASAISFTTVPISGKSTVKNFLRTAIAPIGSTMYVWGGGWNEADTEAGTDARRLGLRSKWRNFAGDKEASYNYRNYRYQIHNGLDCSGFVGWTVYNILNTEDYKAGYVCSASEQAKMLSEQGFGIYTDSSQIKNYKAGDIMSSTCGCCGHVFIVIGQCDDGSVLLVNSSTTGVQLAGTVTPEGRKNSEAYKLAVKYMEKYYAEWCGKFPVVCKGKTYLSHYSQMRWHTTGENVVLSDPEGYQCMSAEKILEDLFEENR